MRWRRRASRRFWPASCRPHLRLSRHATDLVSALPPRHRRDSRDAGAARSSNFELRAILLEFSQSLGLKEHSRGVSFCRASALRARRDESLPWRLTNSWKSIEGPPIVCCFGLGGGLCVCCPVFTPSTRLSLSLPGGVPPRHRGDVPLAVPASRHLYAIDAMASSTPSTQRAPHAIAATPHAIDASLAAGRGPRAAAAAAARRGAPSLRRTSRPGPASCARRRP